MSTPSDHIDPLHNALLPQFEARLTPEYVALYNKHLRGRKHVHELPIEILRKNPSMITFGWVS